jgi:predicted DNA-binding helix-hairpin-helix protein
MGLKDKLNILTSAAKYDVSCSSSGSSRSNKTGGVGNAARAGICHSWADDGRCISLLKILFTNYCIYDCTYCVNRASNDIPRASFSPEEIVNLWQEFFDSVALSNRRNLRLQRQYMPTRYWKNLIEK